MLLKVSVKPHQLGTAWEVSHSPTVAVEAKPGTAEAGERPAPEVPAPL